MNQVRLTLLALSVLGLLTACGSPGETGPAGQAGTDGKNGQDGASCSITTVLPNLTVPNGGTLVTCGTSSALLVNGNPGPQGEPGPVSPYQLSEIIDPCGDAPGIYDEVILRLASGKLLASFSDSANGSNTRLSELTAGSYITSDGSYCYFTVDNNGQIVNEHY